MSEFLLLQRQPETLRIEKAETAPVLYITPPTYETLVVSPVASGMVVIAPAPTGTLRLSK